MEHTGNTCGDGGIDLNLYANGQRTFVQCKHWKTRQVGVKPVRELLGVATGCNAAAGIVVTSGGFTDEAIRFAQTSPRLRLIDGRELQSMIRGIQVAPQRPPLNSAPSTTSPPACPNCGSRMIPRHRKRDGSRFWGCIAFPNCRGMRPA